MTFRIPKLGFVGAVVLLASHCRYSHGVAAFQPSLLPTHVVRRLASPVNDDASSSSTLPSLRMRSASQDDNGTADDGRSKHPSASEWMDKAREGTNSVAKTIAQYSIMCLIAGSLIFAPLPHIGADSADQFIANAATTTEVANQQQPATPLEQTWGLVDKYYIDKSFNGQDWDKVLARYQKRLSSSTDDSTMMKYTTEMVQSLGDRYTRVLTTEQYTSIQKYDLIGVGVTLMPNAQKQIIVGAPPIGGSASAKANLQVGDRILAVNGLQTEGRTAFDIIDQISEQPNARTITFTVQKVDDDVAADLTLERANFAEIKNPVQFKMAERRADGTNVGYIRMTEFNSQIKAKLEDALRDLQRDGANAIVLDLRGNTGGAFQSAVEISNFFLPSNTIATYVVDGNNVELPFRTTTSGDLHVSDDVPIVIWLDGMSASASEVFAGSMHDNCRAVTMGSKSFGKGLIQAVYGLRNGAGLVLTVAKYITPNGTEIQGIGLTPDIAVGLVPSVIPGLGSDTSKVNFGDISKRTGICSLPQERVKVGSVESTLMTSESES